MPTPIAEAFVAVRPDAAGFAKDLKAQLREQVATIKPPVVKVDVAINQATITAMQRKLRETPFVIPVELTIAPGSLTRLQRSVRDAVGKQAAIPVNVTTRVVRGAAAAATAATSAGVNPRASTGSLTAAEREAERLSLLQKQIGLSASEAAKRTYDYQVAVDRAAQANNALAETEKFLRQAQAQANVEGIKAGTSLRAQARETAALASARVQILGATRAGVAPINPEAGVAEASKRAQLAAQDLGEAQVLLQSEVVKSNAALERQAQTLFNARAAALTEAEGIKAAAIAQRDQVSAVEARAAAEAAAQAEIARLSRMQNAIPAAEPGSVKSLAEAQKASSDAEKLAAASAEAHTTVIAAQNPVLLENKVALDVRTASLQKHHAATLLEIQAARELAPAETALAHARDQAARAAATAALVPAQSGLTELQIAQRAASQAAAASTAAAAAQAKFGPTLAVTNAELKAELDLLVATTAELQANTAATLLDAKANAERTAALAQAGRGAAATSASFLGLRGAVLASSAPFLAATIALTAFSKVLGTAGQFQASLNVFQATTGATVEQMKLISDQATKLGNDLTLPATSAVDAANAMTELAKAGLSVNDVLAASKGTLQLAAAANISAADAAKIASTELNAFGLAGSEADHITNSLANASIAAQGSIADFGLAFQQVSAQAKQSGLTFDQTTALLTELARAGISSSDAGTSLRVELARLAPVSKTAQKAMADLGIQIDSTRTIGAQLPSIIDQFSVAIAKLNPQDQTRAFQRIFGQDASRAAIITLTQGSSAFADFERQIQKAGGAQSLTEARAKGLTGAIDGLGSQTQTLANTIGQDFVPVLTAVTHEATKAAGALETLFSAVNPVVSVIGKLASFTFGGGDAAAGVALIAGAAVGLIQGLDKVATKFGITADASAGAASAEVQATNAVKAAVDELTASIGKAADAYIGLGTTSEASSVAQVKATKAATDALAVEAGAAGTAAKALTGAGGAGAGGATPIPIGGKSALGRFSGKGFIAGLLAQVVGGQIPGAGGDILSGAGQGAEFGSFFGVRGAVVGAAAGALKSGFGEIDKREKRKHQEIIDAWNKQTAANQRVFAQENPREFELMLRSLGLDAVKIAFKPDVFQGKLITPPTPAPVQGINAPGFVATNAQQGVARQVPGLLQPGNIDINNRAPVQFGNDFATVRSATIQQDGVFKLIPTVVGNQVVSIKKAIDVFNQTGKNLGTFSSEKAANDYAEALHKQQEGLLKGFNLPQFLADKTKLSTALSTANKGDPGPTARAQLAIAIAQEQGNTDAVVKGFQTLNEMLDQRIYILQLELKHGELSNKAARDLANKIAKLIKERQSNSDAITSALTGGGFDAKQAAIDLATIQAQGTKSNADNLSAAKANEAQAQHNLDIAHAHGKNLSDLQKALATAHNEVVSVQQAIASDAQAAATLAQTKADQAAQAEQLALERAAAASDNRGGAENKLIAFLKKRVQQAKGDTLKLQQAINDLDAEKKKQAEAIKASQQVTFDLRQSAIDAAKAAAANTDTNTDNIRVDRAEIRLINAEINAAKKARDLIKNKATDEWKKAQTEVNKLIATKNAALGTLKSDLGQTGGGFDVFKEAVNQLQTFGSNVTRGQVTTPGGARAAFAGGLLATKLTGLSEADRLHLAEETNTNLLLQKILSAVSDQPTPNAAPRVNGRRHLYDGGFATAAHSRDFSSVVPAN